MAKQNYNDDGVSFNDVERNSILDTPCCEFGPPAQGTDYQGMAREHEIANDAVKANHERDRH